MEFKVEKYCKKDNEFFVKLEGEKGYHKLINGRVLAGQRKEGEYEVYTYEVDSALTEINAEELEELEENYELINPPLTADYDQLSVAQVYSGEKIDSIYNMDSAVNYVKEEQKKLISNPPDEYLRSLKDAAERLYENSYNQDDEKRNKDFDLVKEFLPEGLSANDETLPEKCSVLSLKFKLLGSCSKLVTRNTMKLGNILDYGISHGLEILHYPPEPIKLKHVDNEPDEEFLVIGGDGNPRVARNLEGVLFFINNQRNNGVCCLEPNPLWPIKINFDKTPHEIKIDESRKSPLLTDSFYTGVIELQKKLGTEPFADKFIYAERLMLNSDFVPGIFLPENVSIEKVRERVELDNLAKANEEYSNTLEKLERLKEKAGIKYDKNFMVLKQMM